MFVDSSLVVACSMVALVVSLVGMVTMGIVGVLIALVMLVVVGVVGIAVFTIPLFDLKTNHGSRKPMVTKTSQISILSNSWSGLMMSQWWSASGYSCMSGDCSMFWFANIMYILIDKSIKDDFGRPHSCTSISCTILISSSFAK